MRAPRSSSTAAPRERTRWRRKSARPTASTPLGWEPYWDLYRKRAGFLRNCAMLDLEPDLVIAFTTGSPGTQLTINEARKRGISVEVFGDEA